MVAESPRALVPNLGALDVLGLPLPENLASTASSEGFWEFPLMQGLLTAINCSISKKEEKSPIARAEAQRVDEKAGITEAIRRPSTKAM